MTTPDARLDPGILIERYGLEPIPLEGGMFRQTWRGPATPAGRPAGTAIVALLTTDEDMFSAMHRLPGDEVWHFYLGDPVELLLLHPDGSWELALLGPDVLGGQHVQLVVRAGTWMGGRVADGGAWSLFGCTMAPGFVDTDYEGGTAEELCPAYPGAAERIRALVRPGSAPRHPPGEG